MKKYGSGITLVIEHRVGHVPKERKRISVIQDTLVLQQSLYLGDHLTEDVLESGVGVPLSVLAW
jgi:hypothetical protein